MILSCRNNAGQPLLDIISARYFIPVDAIIYFYYITVAWYVPVIQ